MSERRLDGQEEEREGEEVYNKENGEKNELGIIYAFVRSLEESNEKKRNFSHLSELMTGSEYPAAINYSKL
jgi:hypothetical protein